MVKLGWSWLGIGMACALGAACGDDAVEPSTSAAATSGAAGDASSASNSATNGSGGSSSASTGAGGGALSFETDIWPVLTMTRNPPFSGSNDSCAGANGCHLGGAGGLVLPDA